MKSQLNCESSPFICAGSYYIAIDKDRIARASSMDEYRRGVYLSARLGNRIGHWRLRDRTERLVFRVPSVSGDQSTVQSHLIDGIYPRPGIHTVGAGFMYCREHGALNYAYPCQTRRYGITYKPLKTPDIAPSSSFDDFPIIRETRKNALTMRRVTIFSRSNIGS